MKNNVAPMLAALAISSIAALSLAAGNVLAADKELGGDSLKAGSEKIAVLDLVELKPAGADLAAAKLDKSLADKALIDKAGKDGLDVIAESKLNGLDKLYGDKLYGDKPDADKPDAIVKLVKDKSEAEKIGLVQIEKISLVQIEKIDLLKDNLLGATGLKPDNVGGVDLKAGLLKG